jgi:hypothetical protein
LEQFAATVCPGQAVSHSRIFGEQQVFDYELLFRDGIENFFRATDPEAAARSPLDSTLLMGCDVRGRGPGALSTGACA